jgi:hypothetical protein
MAVEALILTAAWSAATLVLLVAPAAAAQSIQPRSRK